MQEEIFGGDVKEQKSPSTGWIIDVEVANDDKSSVEGEMVLKSIREGNLSHEKGQHVDGKMVPTIEKAVFLVVYWLIFV